MTSSGDQSRWKEESHGKVVRELQVGMTVSQVEAVLGPASSKMSGSDIWRKVGLVSGSTRAISAISKRQYMVWTRPEGEYGLVFVGDKLVEIYSVP